MTIAAAAARMQPPPPTSEAELSTRASAIAGISLGELAASLDIGLPPDLRRRKGAVGELIEAALGATAGSRPRPDFELIGVELKTVPVDRAARPLESTHVCTVPHADLVGEQWATSTVRLKLARVLWVPVLAEPAIPLAARTIGAARLWSPDPAQEAQLRADWEEHMELITTGRIDELDARMGEFLQVRPKALDGRQLTRSSDEQGAPSVTLPRGFYLRPTFTRGVLKA